MASRRFSSPKTKHLFRRINFGKNTGRRFVDAPVGRLCRQNDGDQQRVGVSVFEFGARVRVGRREPREKFLNFARFERAPHCRLIAASQLSRERITRNNPQASRFQAEATKASEQCRIELAYILMCSAALLLSSCTTPVQAVRLHRVVYPAPAVIPDGTCATRVRR